MNTLIHELDLSRLTFAAHCRAFGQFPDARGDSLPDEIARAAAREGGVDLPPYGRLTGAAEINAVLRLLDPPVERGTPDRPARHRVIATGSGLRALSVGARSVVRIPALANCEVVILPEAEIGRFGVAERAYAPRSSGLLVVGRDRVERIGKLLTALSERACCGPSPAPATALLLASQLQPGRRSATAHRSSLSTIRDSLAAQVAGAIEWSLGVLTREYRREPPQPSLAGGNVETFACLLVGAAVDRICQFRATDASHAGTLLAALLACLIDGADAVFRGCLLDGIRWTGDRTDFDTGQYVVGRSHITDAEENLGRYYPACPMLSASLQYAGGLGSLRQFRVAEYQCERYLTTRPDRFIEQHEDRIRKLLADKNTARPLAQRVRLAAYPNLRALVAGDRYAARIPLADLTERECALLVTLSCYGRVPYLVPDCGLEGRAGRPNQDVPAAIRWLAAMAEGTDLLYALEIDLRSIRPEAFRSLLPRIRHFVTAEYSPDRQYVLPPFDVGVASVTRCHARCAAWCLAHLDYETGYAVIRTEGRRVPFPTHLDRVALEELLERADWLE